MKRKLLITIPLLALMLFGTYWFTNHDATASLTKNDRLSIVTTNSILEDMVQQIVGDDAQVYSIVPRGTDPHEYEPRPQDISAVAQADLIFHNGLNLETGGNGWFTKLTTQAKKRPNKEVFAASAQVAPMKLSGENSDQVDPHAWLDLQNGIRYVETISQAIQAADPANRTAYQKRTATYVKQLSALDAQAKAKFQDIPQDKRLLVTSEGAFKYFAKAYGLTPAYIWEINTESQGTPEQMRQVLGQISRSQVTALFVESSVSPKSMEKVAKETGLPIVATVFTDSLAKAGQAGDTYYGMLKWNLDHIHQGLSK
ncbi:metal ABC transporter substrate-binding protein [Lacticaseibacillus brantae]|uniref:ABC-type metal ion transport system, periplasmic component surface adhesin n=1 Tax=Lacticaseibacillus brantae DSM 23927 TaxID=1423727 RepID=A0A0R2B3Y3_9LACO|nr:metal ABC transporter substrate-binding protein [Lacticaseibacillus brantae]KRM71227.1 ABC-type metal ion transport system, periplasmic component surface adhesin [Lacticaseibacillus brantae DSM 23927]